MTRALLAALLVLVVVAAPAAALDVDDLAARLPEDPVLVDEDSTVSPDADAVRAALEGAPVPTYVLVLPQAQVDAEDSGIDGVLLRVVEALDDPRAVVVVVTDAGELQAGEGGASGVRASDLLDRIVSARSREPFDSGSLTGALVEFGAEVGRDEDEGAARDVEGSDRRAVGVAGLVGVGLLAGGVVWARSQRRLRQAGPAAGGPRSGGGW